MLTSRGAAFNVAGMRTQRVTALGKLAMVTIVALLAAPLVSSSPRACDHCPADCPMHAGARMHCHHAGTASHSAQSRHCAATAGIAGPGCDHGGGTPTVVLTRAIPETPPAVRLPPSSVYRSFPDRRGQGRVADPPDSPPPILAA